MRGEPHPATRSVSISACKPPVECNRTIPPTPLKVADQTLSDLGASMKSKTGSGYPRTGSWKKPGELWPLRHILRARQAAFRAWSQRGGSAPSEFDCSSCRMARSSDTFPLGSSPRRSPAGSLEELTMRSALFRSVPKRLPSLMCFPVIAVVEAVDSPNTSA